MEEITGLTGCGPWRDAENRVSCGQDAWHLDRSALEALAAQPQGTNEGLEDAIRAIRASVFLYQPSTYGSGSFMKPPLSTGLCP